MLLQRIFFSPTKTTQMILEGISEGIKAEFITDINLTPLHNPQPDYKINDGLTIIGVPVYSGRVPKIAADRLQKVKANNSPAVLVVVYGNRGYDDALIELKDLAIKTGFRPIAAAAFIAEHSFSSKEKPIGKDRPDEKDLEREKEFGMRINSMFENSNPVNKLNIVDVPGNFPFKQTVKLPPMSPETILDECKKCGTCAKVCPVGAITINGFVETNKDECILCNACVKNCPAKGRVLENDFVNGLREKLYSACSSRKEPEFFFN